MYYLTFVSMSSTIIHLAFTTVNVIFYFILSSTPSTIVNFTIYDCNFTIYDCNFSFTTVTLQFTTVISQLKTVILLFTAVVFLLQL
jgi:hypothetical protein